MASLFANVRKLPIPNDSIIHVQRPDYLSPFLLGGVGARWVCTVHGNPYLGMRNTRGAITFSGYTLLEAVLLRKASSTVFVDSGAEAQYLLRYPWLEGSTVVIPNAVDLGIFRPADRSKEKARWNLTGTTFLYAGRLEPEKQVGEIIRAFQESRLDSCQLVIAGDGRERSTLQREAQNPNIQFLGPIEQSKMPSLLNAVDALVLYSAMEGLPSIVLEALACGTPVIAAPAGAVPLVVRDMENGRLVRSRRALTGAMREVWSGRIPAGPSIAASIEPYSWARIGPKILQLYETVARRVA